MPISNRRSFLRAIGASVAATATLPAATPKPNIVYVLADDLGWGDMQCYNKDSAVPTPNGDRLASEGVRFTDMHSPSSVCTPTRYGILTGRYCWRSRLKKGVLNGYSPNLIEPGRLTVASMLKSQGYYTGGIGKWHLGLGTKDPVDFSKPLDPNPSSHGFDYYFGIPASLDMAPYLYFENGKTAEQPTSQTPGKNEPRGVFWREGPIAPSFTIEGVLPALTRKAVEFIGERAKQRDQPFFLYLPLTGPHTPWVPLKEFEGKSKAGIYGDFVAQVDHTLGQVLKALDDAKLSDNTLFVFTSDNGAHWTPEDKARYPHRANANWRGMKADIWDAGHRIPFLVRWPGKTKTGAVSNQLGCLIDLMATASEVVDFKLPDSAGEDSFSWLPAATGSKPKTALREAVVHHSSDGLFAIRSGEWKLAMGHGSWGFSDPKRVDPKPGDPAGELFRIGKDQQETTDLFLKEPRKVKELTALLDRYKRDGRSR